jgi:hypothetical protein
MSNDDTTRELEKLRADVAALSEARREDAAKAEAPRPEPAPVAEAQPEAVSLPEEQRSQIEELGELLHKEIRDLPTITALTVFSLGILMGRLMR